MKIIQIILQKTTASKLWFSTAVVLIAMLNVSAVEAKTLKNGEEFKEQHSGPFGSGTESTVIRVVSSDEVEIDARGRIILGKYTIDGDRVRIVISGLGTVVQYYKIIPDGLVEEKGGKVFYSKAGLTAKEQARVLSAQHYLISSNGTEVIDKKTGLIWRRCVEGMVYNGNICTGRASQFTYEQALQHAAAQARNTGIAWRVPNKDELVSIVDKKFSDPTIDPTAFPATPSMLYWSTHVMDSATKETLKEALNKGLVTTFSLEAEGIPFGLGGYSGFASDFLMVRLVRAGQQDRGK